MKGWLNIIFWCERFIITLKKRFFVWILWSLLHCFAIDAQRKRKLWIRSDLERDSERPVCLNLFFLCLCNNWRHWCEVGENLLFQIADVNCAFCGLPNFIGIPGIENVWIDQYYTCNMYDFNFFSSIEYSNSKHKSNYVFDKYFGVINWWKTLNQL